MNTIAKICGIMTPEALDAAIDGGADYIGLVFFAKSPRNLDIDRAKVLAERARGKVKIVALTVDADDSVLKEIVDRVGPDFLQLHGDEVPGRVAEIKTKFGRAVIKAIPVATADDADKARNYADVADLILFDAMAAPGADSPGGNGQAFDWAVLEAISEDTPFMLSGGLNPDNVAAAIAQARPVAVDVSSGVEVAPGVKDPARILRFLHAVKTAKQS
jgi:phosphoribosylanthranilate isomerase